MNTLLYYFRLLVISMQFLGVLGIFLAAPFALFFFALAVEGIYEGHILASIPGLAIAISFIALPFLSGLLAFQTFKNEISTIKTLVPYLLISTFLMYAGFDIIYPYLVLYGLIITLTFSYKYLTQKKAAQ